METGGYGFVTLETQFSSLASLLHFTVVAAFRSRDLGEFGDLPSNTSSRSSGSFFEKILPPKKEISARGKICLILFVVSHTVRPSILRRRHHKVP